MDAHHHLLAQQLGMRPQQVAAIAALLEDGGTVPFIARYRKEATGSADEAQITAVRDGLERLAALSKRRETILQSLTERELLTKELERHILAAEDLVTLEDIYLPYRPKRRTRPWWRANKGYSHWPIFYWRNSNKMLMPANSSILKKVPDTEAALAGARDIIAEQVSEDADLRQDLRTWFAHDAALEAKVVAKRKDDPEAAKFRDWFDWSEPVERAPSHRVLALLRGAEQKSPSCCDQGR